PWSNGRPSEGSVNTRPPVRSRASSTTTPSRAPVSVCAAAKPASPAPTTATSISAARAGCTKGADSAPASSTLLHSLITTRLYAIEAAMWSSLLATARGALWLSADGEVERLSGPESARRAASTVPLVVHAPATAARLGLETLAARDLLELYAFVRPASFC